MRLRVAHKAEGHQSAIPHPFFGTHPHFGAHLLPGLLALIGFGRHQHGFQEAPGGGVPVGGVVQGNELDILRFELFIEHIEVAAAGQAVIPGTKHAINLAGIDQMAQVRQAGPLEGAGADAFVLDCFADLPALCLAEGFQFFDLRFTTGILAARLLLGAHACIERHALGRKLLIIARLVGSDLGHDDFLGRVARWWPKGRLPDQDAARPTGNIRDGRTPGRWILQAAWK